MGLGCMTKRAHGGDGIAHRVGDVKRTYIPKLLGMLQDINLYLVQHQHHMIGAGDLNAVADHENFPGNALF